MKAARFPRPYVTPLLTSVDLRAKSALAEEQLSKLSIFAQPAPPPTSTSNVEGGTVFGSQSAPLPADSSGRTRDDTGRPHGRRGK